MTWLWLSVFAGLVFELARRHGWEHVPFVALVGMAHWYATGLGFGDGADPIALSAIGGVWLSVKGTTLGAREWESRRA